MLLRILLLYLISWAGVVNSEGYWQQQEAQVLKVAEEENLPIIAVFYGANGCPWSQKLREEVLEHPEFRKSLLCAAVFWQSGLIGDAEDKQIREKYRIKVSPLILLLDPKGREFARFDYMPWDMQEYAMEISARIADFQELCLCLKGDASYYSEEKWIELYRKAQKLSAPCYKQVVLEKGLQRESGTFFHLEKLACLLQKYKLKHPQVIKFKKKVLEKDSSNVYGTHFKVATLEFNKMLRKRPRGRLEKPLLPLFQYLRHFGKSDRENCWKAELMIAEYLAEKNAKAQALKYAEASYAAAPEDAKPQILETIAYLKKEEEWR